MHVESEIQRVELAVEEEAAGPLWNRAASPVTVVVVEYSVAVQIGIDDVAWNCSCLSRVCRNFGRGLKDTGRLIHIELADWPADRRARDVVEPRVNRLSTI